MNLSSNIVALLGCHSYERPELKEKIDMLCRALPFTVGRGDRVLLKPNLVTARGHDGLAVSNPQFMAAVAEWFLDYGAMVAIGDSPAIGRATQVMKACGISMALRGLPVKLINFKTPRRMSTAHGFSVDIAAEIFDYDYLVNLPRLKAHGQLRITMAVKNCFGVVLSCRKALAHMRYGGEGGAFARLLVDILDLLPDGLTIVDGVEAMHRDGPITGQMFPARLLGACENPVALDTALLEIIGVPPASTMLWRECHHRGLTGTRLAELDFPLRPPADLAVDGFVVPEHLSPLRFQIGHFVINSIKKFFR